MKFPALLGSLLFAASLLAQGSLTPPGAPAATMKTLDQVESRIPISSLPFSISTPGSYYLTANLSVSSGNGINIIADQVTLDLNGYAIASTASPAAGTAIVIQSVRRNITIKNGSIRGTTTVSAGVFATGGFLDGIQGSSGTSANLLVSRVQVHGLGADGISFSTSAVGTSVVEYCNVSVCAGGGIFAGLVRGCTVDLVGGSGIDADSVFESYGETVGSGNFPGVQGTSLIDRCRGVAVGGSGIIGLVVSNSRGSSTSGIGINATTATNCEGTSTSGTAGISALGGTVSFSRGRRDGGTAIVTLNAVACTVAGTGTVSATNKTLGTP